MKKSAVIFLSIVTVCCSALGISACGSSADEPEHTHTYNTDNVCTECGYELEYTEGLAYLLYENEYVFLGGGSAETTDVTLAAYYNGLPVTSVALYGYDEFLAHISALIATGSFTENEFAAVYENYYGDSITSITIPDGVTYVRLYGYDNLVSASLPESVSHLDILYCDSLKEVNIPSKALYVYIYDCPLLETETVDGLTYYKNCLLYWDENLTKAEIREGTTTISQRTLGTESNITEVTIPQSMTVISEYAFESCTSLKSVSIPDSVTYIGYCAFAYCTSLKSITIPDNATYIGVNAFYMCTSLTNITLGKNLTAIDTLAFGECYNLAEVYNLSSLEITSGSEDNGCVGYYDENIYTATSGESHLVTQGDYLFVYDGDNNYYLIAYNGTQTDITLPESVNGNAYSINQCAFFFSTVKSITIPDCFTCIGDFAFAYCSSLESITIPSSVTTIGDYAFWCCSSLESINIPDSVTSIGNMAFSGCHSLSSVVIPDSVTSIGYWAFNECWQITSVIIGSGVQSIGSCAFMGCYNINAIYYNGTAEEWSAISIDENNGELTSGNVYYYAENDGTTTAAGDYWYYGENGNIVTWNLEDTLTEWVR